MVIDAPSLCPTMERPASFIQSASQSFSHSQWTLPSLKKTCEKAIGMMLDDSGRTHKRPYETDATLDDSETFALYSGPEERLPCYYEHLPEKEADEKAEEKAAAKKRPSKQRPKSTHVINTGDTP